MKIFIYGLIALILVSALVGFILFGGAESSRVSLEFNEIGEVAMGEQFALEVSFSNNSDEVLKNARLSITLPGGISLVGENQDQRVMEKLVGDIGPASLGKESFNLIATYQEESIREIQAKLIYNSSANEKVIFETQNNLEFKVGKPATQIETEIPETVFSGEKFELKIKYQNIAEAALKNLTLRVDYPATFKFEKSTTPPDTANNIWEGISLSSKEEREMVISGSILGQTGANFDFKISLSETIAGEDYVVQEKIVSLKVAEAPLALTLAVKGSKGEALEGDYIARLGDMLKYTLYFENNGNVNFQNITIQAKLTGEMFDFQQIISDGVFNAFNKTLTWTGSNVSDLVNLESNRNGQVSFEIKLKDNFDIRRLSDKDYLLKVEAQIESPTNVSGSSGSLVSMARLDTKIAGQPRVDVQVFFRDATSGILNKGNFPPKVGQATQFTVHLKAMSLGTDLSQVQVVASLGSGVKWTGQVKGGSGSDPIYDSGKNQVIWTLDKILANRGIVGESAEAVFQIEITPSVSQVNQILTLVGQASLTGEDAFTGIDVTAIGGPVDTNLPNDLTVAGLLKTVQP